MDLPQELAHALDAALIWWRALPDEARNIILSIVAAVISAPLLYLLSRPFRRRPTAAEAVTTSSAGESDAPAAVQPSDTRALVAQPQPLPRRRSSIAAATLDETEKRLDELTSEGSFFGRAPEVAVLDALVTGNDRGVLLLTGPGGMGKSSLLANWAMGQRKAGARIAAHFFSLRYPATRTLVDAYQSLLVQLRDHLGEVAVPEIPPEDKERELRDAITAALCVDATPEAPVIVILDALDEADRDVPALVPAQLGRHVYIVASERVDDGGEPDRLKPWLREHGRRRYPVQPLALGPLSVQGVVAWLHDKLPPGTAIDERAVAEKLERTTDGVPLFLQYVIDDLARVLKDGRHNPAGVLARISRLPEPFTGYARERLDELADIGGAVWARDVRRLFALIASTNGPIAIGELRTILKSGDADLDILGLDPRVLRWFSRRLGEREPLLAFMHPRLGEVFGRALAESPDTQELASQARRALLDHCRGWREHGGDYAINYVAQHLAAASQIEPLRDLLLDPAWMKAKLELHHSPQPLLADYRASADELGDTTKKVRQTLELLAGILTRDERQLVPQLLGRLDAPKEFRENESIQRLLSRARALVQPPLLLPIWGNLRAGGGAENARLEGHRGWVTALLQLADGRLASASEDNTVRLWDPPTGAEIARLEGHGDAVTALLQLAD
ncbi:MAG: AAA family ATPase, partial [Hyphomicrobiaceae bacterium]